MPDGKHSILERAAQLAASGTCKSILQIDKQLNAEGYEGVHAHLAGFSTRAKLRALIAAARKSPETLDPQ